MDTALATKTMRRESWAATLRDQASSGLTIHEWCDQNQISTKPAYVQLFRISSDRTSKTQRVCKSGERSVGNGALAPLVRRSSGNMP